MKLKIENFKLNDVILLLDKLPLKGLKSIHRTRLSQQLTKKLERVIEEQDAIRKEFCHLDEEGNPIVKKDGSLDVRDKEEFDKAIKGLVGEMAIVDGGDSQVFLKSVKQSLESTELEFEGNEAYTYAYLYEAFQDEENEETSAETEDTE